MTFLRLMIIALMVAGATAVDAPEQRMLRRRSKCPARCKSPMFANTRVCKTCKIKQEEKRKEQEEKRKNFFLNWLKKGEDNQRKKEDLDGR